MRRDSTFGSIERRDRTTGAWSRSLLTSQQAAAELTKERRRADYERHQDKRQTYGRDYYQRNREEVLANRRKQQARASQAAGG